MLEDLDPRPTRRKLLGRMTASAVGSITFSGTALGATDDSVNSDDLATYATEAAAKRAFERHESGVMALLRQNEGEHVENRLESATLSAADEVVAAADSKSGQRQAPRLLVSQRVSDGVTTAELFLGWATADATFAVSVLPEADRAYAIKRKRDTERVVIYDSETGERELTDDAIVGEQCAPIDCDLENCACARREIYCDINASSCYYGSVVGECSDDATCVRKCCEACSIC